MYVLAKSKSDSLLTKREIFTDRKDVTLFVDEIARERMTFCADDATEEKLYGVCLRTRDPRICRGKSSFGRCGKLALLIIGQSPYRWLEKDASSPWGKVVSGKRRSWKNRFLLSSRSWNKDCLSVGMFTVTCRYDYFF